MVSLAGVFGSKPLYSMGGCVSSVVARFFCHCRGCPAAVGVYFSRFPRRFPLEGMQHFRGFCAEGRLLFTVPSPRACLSLGCHF